MYKISNMNLIYKRYPLKYFFESTYRLDIKSIELWGGYPHIHIDNININSIKKIYKETNKRNLEVICFTPEQCDYPINISSKNRRVKEQSIKYLKKSIRISKELNCKKVLISSGFGYYNDSFRENWKRCKESIHRLVKFAEKENMILIIEPFYFPYSNIVINKDTTKKILNEINSKNLKMMVDIPCMVMSEETLDEYFDLFKEKLKHIHFVDGNYESSAHLVWGDGVYNINKLKKNLDRYNYKGYLSLELNDVKYYSAPEKAVKNSLTYLRNHQLYE